MNLQRFASHTLPLALLTFGLVTVKTVDTCPGEVDLVRYGFPLAWIRPALFTSMGLVINPLTLAIDFAVYLGLWVLLAQTGLFKRVFAWRPRLAAACLWAFALIVSVLYGLLLVITGYIGDAAYNQGDCLNRVQHHSACFGLPLP